MCDCKCSERKQKRERVFDIVNKLTGEMYCDVYESQLSAKIEEITRNDGWEVEHLKITEEIFVYRTWVINE